MAQQLQRSLDRFKQGVAWRRKFSEVNSVEKRKMLSDSRIDENPDVLRVKRTAIGTLFVMAITFVFAFALWNDKTKVVFAIPSFPTRDNKPEISLTPPEAPTSDRCDGLTTGMQYVQLFEDNLALAQDDCRYNHRLDVSYDILQMAMLRYPKDESGTQIVLQYPCLHYDRLSNINKLICLREANGKSWLPDLRQWGLSIEALVKFLAIMTAFFGTLVFSPWYGTAKDETDEILYCETLPKSLLYLLLILIWTTVLFLATDALRLMLVVGVSILWVGGIGIVLLVCAALGLWAVYWLEKWFPKFSTSLVLSFAMAILVYLVIDIVWFMFERVVPMAVDYERGTAILFAVLVLGVISFFLFHWVNEPSIVQISVFATMILILGLIAGIMVTNHVWETGVTNAFSVMSERAYPERLAFEVAGQLGSRNIFRLTFAAAGMLLVVYAAHLTLLVQDIRSNHSTFEEQKIMRATGVGILGSATGVLTMFVGLFPTDEKCIPVALGSIQFDACLSSLFHGIGAGFGVIFMLLIVMTYWFLGHPYKSPYIASMRRFSWFGVTISAAALLIHILDFRIPQGVGLIGSGLAIVSFAAVLCLILWWANWWFRDASLDNIFWSGCNWLTHPLWQSIFITLAAIGMVWITPPVVNTVALEFIVLSVFACFTYLYSLYTKEYRDDATNM